MDIQTAEWLRVARLVRRTGFAATGPEVDEAVRLGSSEYLRQALTADPAVDPGVVATPAPELKVVARPGRNAGTEERKQYKNELKDGAQALILWWIQRMAAVRSPLVEKLTFSWHNHFATAIVKVKQPAAMQIQNETLRRFARTSFRDLAAAMLIDPAMLFWLDGQKNTAGAPNENLSREFIELFTLGHGGGYTEQDVREGARALTGWRITADGARRDPDRHDDGTKTFLGLTGNLDENDFLEAVLVAPSTAAHIATRLYGQLVSDDIPDSAFIADVSSQFGVDWDISGLMTRMLLSPEFDQAAGTSIVSPVEWLIGAVRALNITLDRPKAGLQLAKILQSLGQLPFDPPSVGGWPTGQGWLSTAAVDIRMQTALLLADWADLEVLRSAASAERVDLVGYLLGIGSWSARSRKVLQENVSQPKTLTALALNTVEYLTH